MGSVYGTIFKISTWGESHGKAFGVVIDGCPAGIPLNEEDIQSAVFDTLCGNGFSFYVVPAK